MVCTYCSSETDVFNTRPQKRSNSVWRRRRCKECNAVFSTIETIDYEKSWVVQYSDGSKAPFIRDKLFASIFRSIQHRPTALQDTIALTRTAIGRVGLLIENGSLQSPVIAAEVQRMLHRFDKPAAVSYQAFHTDVLR